MADGTQNAHAAPTPDVFGDTGSGPALPGQGYLHTRTRVETYFDRTATKTWEQLTSDAPVSRIRATVRAGRARMRDVILGQLPADLTGLRVLDAGCGTGALSVEIAARGAEVLGVDISPQLIEIARKRTPKAMREKISFHAGDMRDARHGAFDHAVAMDSLIYYTAPDIAAMFEALRPRMGSGMIFTVAPRTPLLMLMWRLGKLFPRADRSPSMVPQSLPRLAKALHAGSLRDVARVNSGFYISHALEYRP